jgi:hypothetical protein
MPLAENGVDPVMLASWRSIPFVFESARRMAGHHKTLATDGWSGCGVGGLVKLYRSFRRLR